MTGAAQRPVITTLALAGMALLLTWLVFIGGGWAGIYDVRLRVLSLGLLTTLMVAWGVAAWRRPAWQPSSRLLPALGLGLLAMILSTALSPTPRLGFDYVAYAILLVACYLFLVRVLAQPDLRGRFMDLVAMLAGVVGVAYVGEVFARWIEWWGLVGGFAPPPLRPAFAALTLGNPSAVMTVSILLTLPAVAHVGFGTRRRALVSAVLIALAGFCTIVSGSRAGWLALALAAVITAIAWLLVPGHRARIRRATATRQVRLGLAGIAAVGILLAVLVLPGVMSRFGAGGETLRQGYYTAAARIFLDSPIVGTGPGTWVAERASVTDSPADDYSIPHAHDVYLQTLAELGLVGAIVGAVGIFLVGRLVYRAIRSETPGRRAMAWAATFGLLYFGAHQLLDFYANMPAALGAMAIPIAWLDATDPHAAADGLLRRPGPKRAIPVVGVGLVVVAIAWLGLSESRALVHQDAVARLNDGDWAGALERARQAATADPDVPAYQFTLGLAAMNAGQPAEAAGAYARAARADDFPESWLGLAAAQAKLGNADGARTSLERAMRLGRRSATIDVAAAQVYSSIGDAAAARQAALEAVTRVPSLAGDPALGALIQPATTDDFVATAVSELGPSSAAVQVALERNDRPLAESLVGQSSPEDRALLSIVVPAWFGDATATAQLADLARRRPQDLATQQWAAQVAEHAGRQDEAGAYQRIADIDLFPYSGVGRETRLVPPGDSGAGGDISTYGAFTYRRPTPFNMLPASLFGLRSD